MQNLYKDNLIQVGLSEKEALVYEALISSPKATVGQLLHKLPGIKRPNLYALLEALKGKRLVLELSEHGKKAFQAESPQKLVEFTEKREQEYKQSKINLENALPSLLSQFNLASGKPNVRFFEGLEGAKKVMWDSLTSRTEIYSYVDSAAVEEHFRELNNLYVKERFKKGIKKKFIALDSPNVRDLARSSDPALTEIRVLDAALYPFAAVMQIYDNRVSYQTVEKDQMIGVLIEDPRIYKMQKTLFEHSWANATDVMPPPPREAPSVDPSVQIQDR
ncbi:MAG: hypothetical protein A2542_04080 [Parcubacteria group bacterium RIFOXYD2_FULL_52_8]|nr:MAG: hypothetical protein A2542_04080 [Parcubacteria group bacterium RIFOXYD2_FULL_52_8]